MKLILEREQRMAGLINKKQVFAVTFQAELSQTEREAINKYLLADEVLYESHELLDEGTGLLGLASRLKFSAILKTLNVRDLVKGKTIECGDIVEMKGVEEQVLEAAQNFKLILDTAATFGGREVIEL